MEVRVRRNDRASRVVNSFARQVPSKATLLSLQSLHKSSRSFFGLVRKGENKMVSFYKELIDQSTDWLINRLTDWLTDRWMNRQTDRWMDRWTDQQPHNQTTDRPTHQLIDLIDWLIDWLIETGWLADWLTDWLINLTIDRLLTYLHT